MARFSVKRARERGLQENPLRFLSQEDDCRGRKTYPADRLYLQERPLLSPPKLPNPI